jgi:glutathione transport system substrate-binding protein
MNRVDQFGALFEQWQSRGLNRRLFLRLVALGTSAATLSTIMTACSGSSTSATSAPGTPTKIAGTAATQASPTPLAQTVGSAAANPNPVPTAAAFTDKPFLVALNGEPDTLDIHDSTANTSLGVYKAIYEGLVSLDEKMRVVNLLAESWQPSADAKEFTFKLKKGVKFHDGTPFNADAVKQTFDRVLANDAKLKRHGYFGAVIDHAEVVDDGTVKLVTKQPFAALVATIAHPAGGIPSPAAFNKYGQDFGIHPVGTGPFKFTDWARGDRITLDANPDYWSKEIGPAVSKLIIKGIAEPSALGIAVQSGDAQYAGPLNPPQALQLKNNKDVTVSETDSILIYYVTLNNSKKPFDNKMVRQALNYGVNKDEVLKAADLGQGKIIDSPLAAGVYGYHSAKSYPYDAQKAKDLLKQAGLPDGFKSVLWTSAGAKDRAVAIQGQLQRIGVTVEVVQMEAAALTAEAAKPVDQSQVQMLMSGVSPSTGDADLALRLVYTKDQWPPAGITNSFYTNPQLEEYVKQGLQFTDEAKRKDAYAKAQDLIMEEVPNIFLYAPTFFGAIRNTNGGVIVQADGVVYMRTAYYKK